MRKLLLTTLIISSISPVANAENFVHETTKYKLIGYEGTIVKSNESISVVYDETSKFFNMLDNVPVRGKTLIPLSTCKNGTGEVSVYNHIVEYVKGGGYIFDELIQWVCEK